MRSLRREDKRVPRARRLRRDMTDAERRLWWRLRAVQIKDFHFRRQATIGPYFVDFACHATRIVIELDGGQHGEAGHALRDSKRDAYLRHNGYRVLRFWNNDVLGNIEGVMYAIIDALENVPPTPNPSPPLASLAGGGKSKRRA